LVDITKKYSLDTFISPAACSNCFANDAPVLEFISMSFTLTAQTLGAWIPHGERIVAEELPYTAVSSDHRCSNFQDESHSGMKYANLSAWTIYFS